MNKKGVKIPILTLDEIINDSEWRLIKKINQMSWDELNLLSKQLLAMLRGKIKIKIEEGSKEFEKELEERMKKIKEKYPKIKYASWEGIKEVICEMSIERK